MSTNGLGYAQACDRLLAARDKLKGELGLAALAELAAVLLVSLPEPGLAARVASLCGWPELAAPAEVEAARREAVELFVNPASGRYFVPAESALTEGRLSGEASALVAEAYLLAGFAPSRLASRVPQASLPDHLGVELAFAASWLAQAGEEEGRAGGAGHVDGEETRRALAWMSRHPARFSHEVSRLLKDRAWRPWHLLTAVALDALAEALSEALAQEPDGEGRGESLSCPAEPDAAGP